MKLKRSRAVAWAVAALVLLALALAATRAVQKRQATGQAVVALPPAAAELAPTDLVQAQRHSLRLGLPISGTLRAVNTALVKARVAGELQGLQVREGDTVAAGQVLARIDPTEYRARLQQAEQQAEGARAQLAIAQRQFDTNQALVAQQFISRNALQTSEANLQAAQASHRAALAAVELARKALDDTVLRAPIAGQVAQRLAQPGERVGVDARVLEIVDTRQLELEASVSAAESLQLAVGQRAQLQLDGGPLLEARLVRINPSAQAASRSVLAYLSVDAGGAALRQGLFVQGTLGTARREAVAVPLSAVRRDQPQPYVQLIREGQVAHQPVRLGATGSADGQELVEVDLPEGAAVLRGSVGLLRPGLPVRLTPLAP